MTVSLRNTFQASQEEFFTCLEAKLSALDRRMRECEAQVDALATVSDNLAVHALALSNRGPAPTAWSYDARLPNVYFAGVFEPEASGGSFKRWVGASACLAGRLMLDRRFQYRCEVEIVDFITPEAEASFRLVVGDRPWVWLSTAGRIFSTIITEAPDEIALDFTLEVPSANLQDDKDVSFSFRRLSFSRVG